MTQSGLGAVYNGLECLANEGYVILEQSWDCSYGTFGRIAECTQFTRDCSECKSTGTGTDGRYRYQENYLEGGVGGGWDCRHKCSRLASLLGLSGTEKEVIPKECPEKIDDNDDYEIELGKLATVNNNQHDISNNI